MAPTGRPGSASPTEMKAFPTWLLLTTLTEAIESYGLNLRPLRANFNGDGRSSRV